LQPDKRGAGQWNLSWKEASEMDVYHIALFLHVSSDIGLFIGWGVQRPGLTTLRRVERVEQARGMTGENGRMNHQSEGLP
jgi:hypothetical protein